MILAKDFNPDDLIKYGFKKEDHTYEIDPNYLYKFFKPNRKSASLIIEVYLSGRTRIVFHHPSDYWWDDIPDILLDLINKSIIVKSEQEVK